MNNTELRCKIGVIMKLRFMFDLTVRPFGLTAVFLNRQELYNV